MPIVQPFDGDNFSMASLTGAINILPNNYGLLAEKNLFPFLGRSTVVITLDYNNGILNLITSKKRGDVARPNKSGTRQSISFSIPHFPLDDVILPEDFQGVRKFGSENELEGMEDVMLQKLTEIKMKHDITHEWLRMGALKGIIYDGDGTTVLYNLFTEFGISQKSIDFVLGTAATDVTAKCRLVRRHIEQNLKGELMSNVRVLVDSAFFDKLTGHDNVKRAFDNWQAASGFYAANQRKSFTFGEITFEEYVGTADDANGTPHPFIPATEGIAYPEGTVNTFKMLGAPADFLETANTIAQQYYVKQEPRKYNRGIDIHSQSNVLPLCQRPAVLVRCHTSN